MTCKVHAESLGRLKKVQDLLHSAGQRLREEAAQVENRQPDAAGKMAAVARSLEGLGQEAEKIAGILGGGYDA